MIVKKMFKTAVLAVFCGAVAFPAVSRAAAFYLYYNINSPHLDEIGVDGSEVAKVFDDEFGPASEELPSEVKSPISLLPNIRTKAMCLCLTRRLTAASWGVIREFTAAMPMGI